MGISLNYSPLSKVSPEIWKHIEAERENLISQYSWWCEPINFYGSFEEGHSVFGDSKVFLVAYSVKDGSYVQVDYDDDLFMAYRDIKFIIQTLADWSKRFGVDWTLDLYDEPFGKIIGGQPDKAATKSLKELSRGCKRDPESPDVDSVVQEIRKKYESRFS